MIGGSQNAVLVLSDGRYFFGRSLGSKKDCIGEVCFTTGFTGYQYTITDPSFAGQIVAFAFPHIGSVGVNLKDFECSEVLAKGVIVREISSASHVSSKSELDAWMMLNNLSGISGVDTRALIMHLREQGTQSGIIHNFEDPKSVDINQLKNAASSYKERTFATELPHLADHVVSGSGLKVCVIDFGAKRGILNSLAAAGCAVDVVAAQGDFATRAMSKKPRGIVISNGPGDPADIFPLIAEQLRILLDSGVPILGICLGHQLLAMAMGAKTVKMLHGHRGSNHPVYNVATKMVEVTSQNHGFAVDANTLPANVEITHTSLFDGTVEGMRLTDKPVFSVQFHPEGCPGPSDSHYIFDDFVSLAAAVPCN